jgi:hypothetical protein
MLAPAATALVVPFRRWLHAHPPTTFLLSTRLRATAGAATKPHCPPLPWACSPKELAQSLRTNAQQGRWATCAPQAQWDGLAEVLNTKYCSRQELPTGLVQAAAGQTPHTLGEWDSPTASGLGLGLEAPPSPVSGAGSFASMGSSIRAKPARLISNADGDGRVGAKLGGGVGGDSKLAPGEVSAGEAPASGGGGG